MNNAKKKNTKDIRKIYYSLQWYSKSDSKIFNIKK